MNTSGSSFNSSESADLTRYQQAADLAYQYAKNRARKQEESDTQDTTDDEDQAVS